MATARRGLKTGSEGCEREEMPKSRSSKARVHHPQFSRTRQAWAEGGSRPGLALHAPAFRSTSEAASFVAAAPHVPRAVASRKHSTEHRCRMTAHSDAATFQSGEEHITLRGGPFAPWRPAIPDRARVRDAKGRTLVLRTTADGWSQRVPCLQLWPGMDHLSSHLALVTPSQAQAPHPRKPGQGQQA